MANTETRDYRSELHCLLAFRRRKDNPEGPVTCFREIIRDEPVDLERLKVRVRQVPGKWRIHRTVNPRNVAKATSILMHRLLDRPSEAEALETVWKTCLLQKESRGARNILLDVDDPTELDNVLLVIRRQGLEPSHVVKTPSGGFHVVSPTIDTRELRALTVCAAVEVQRDGYVFLEEMEVLRA